MTIAQGSYSDNIDNFRQSGLWGNGKVIGQLCTVYGERDSTETLTGNAVQIVPNNSKYQKFDFARSYHGLIKIMTL